MDARQRYHEGERYVQERAGERDTALRLEGFAAGPIPVRAMSFLAEQRMLAIGSVDEHGEVLASVFFGKSGLASSVDGRSLHLDRTRIDVHDDPLWGNLRVGADVGLLAIELGSRRRLRINGVVSHIDAARIDVDVHEAYPNCPKYIQRRIPLDAPSVRSGFERPRIDGLALDDRRTRLIERADTLFVASRHPERGLDVSHRGGAPGFVRVVNPTRIRIPDYRGNSMFNTLGNFAVDDRAGAVVMDFEDGTLLQMTGTATLQFDQPDDARQPTGGTGRYWDFNVERWLEAPIRAPIAWQLMERSPHNPHVAEPVPGDAGHRLLRQFTAKQ
jgi:predicted pyridoxine 5'-phosphate oxidase superfamily flavin-nucleotide-binding protein